MPTLDPRGPERVAEVAGLAAEPAVGRLGRPRAGGRAGDGAGPLPQIRELAARDAGAALRGRPARRALGPGAAAGRPRDGRRVARPLRGGVAARGARDQRRGPDRRPGSRRGRRSGAGLEAALSGKLDGELSGRDEELRVALAAARGEIPRTRPSVSGRWSGASETACAGSRPSCPAPGPRSRPGSAASARRPTRPSTSRSRPATSPTGCARTAAARRAPSGAIPASVVMGRQVHGAELRGTTSRRSRGSTPTRCEAPTRSTRTPPPTPGLTPLVMVADCLPVALAGPGGVAMAHGGWRGLAGRRRRPRPPRRWTRRRPRSGPGSGPAATRSATRCWPSSRTWTASPADGCST